MGKPLHYNGHHNSGPVIEFLTRLSTWLSIQLLITYSDELVMSWMSERKKNRINRILFLFLKPYSQCITIITGYLKTYIYA